ncbi:glycosyltransferase family 4 protein [bacterium]|nr:glycosyltransferase family 4 protein [bacterium]
MAAKRNFKIAFVGNYLPRKCGIATFTFDLETAVNTELRNDESTFVVAMNNTVEGYPYPDKVKRTIFQPRIDEYREAAAFLNQSDADVVCIQHEFGIFGGNGGEFIVDLMRHLKKPSIVTHHTIFKDPPEPYKTITKDIASLAHGLVVMSERAVGYLEDSYGIPAKKVRMIHHGVPSVGFTDTGPFKAQFGFEGRTVIGTFGLLSRNKGIEHVIRALPSLVEKHPDLLYVVLGETHPEVIKHEGEKYRESLIQMAEDLGIGSNVKFISKFLALKDLVKFLQAVDMYVTPYQGKEQITSGTLAYSLAAGKPIVSTPYWYAQELLDDGRGILVEFGEDNGIGDALMHLLDNPDEREIIRERAFKYGRRMTWSSVAQRYIEYFKEAQRDRIVFKAPVAYSEMRPSAKVKPISFGLHGKEEYPNMKNGSLPRQNMGHIQVLTDYTGIIQHAIYSVPDRTTGYCIDDNSRALISAVKAQEFFPEKVNVNLAKTYLSFIHYAQLEDGRFHNFMHFERRFLDEVGSEDSFGRTMWALGYLIEHTSLLDDVGMDSLARQIFTKALPNAKSMVSPRAWAYSMIGLYHYLRRFEDDSQARELMRDFADRLMSLYKAFSNDEWKWFEPIIAYDNGKLPQALYHAGEVFRDKDYYNAADESLEFLTKHVFEDDIFVPIGTQGWMRKGEKKARFDQQPIEGSSMIDVYLTAARSPSATTKQIEKYEELSHRAWTWFMGQNVVGVPLYDPASGSCADGLGEREASLNQGAESTLAAVMALQSMRENLKRKTVDKIVTKIKMPKPKTPKSNPKTIEIN